MFERRILRKCIAQLRKMVYGDEDITMNFINYIMNNM
jgi:hypothetical protein